MGEEYKKNKGRNFILEYLMRDKATAKLLLTKPMAPVFALNEEKCKTHLIEISKALQKRIQDGRRLVYENLEWKELLQKISLNAISLNDLEFSTDIKKSKWLGFEPATSSNIEATEKILNISLPNEYKQFLQTTNGFNAYTVTGLNIHPVEKIDFLKNLDSDIYETLLKENEGMISALEKTLLIGGLHEDMQLLLVPSKDKKTWECWVFAYWMINEMKFENFRFYIESELLQLEEESFSKE